MEADQSAALLIASLYCAHQGELTCVHATGSLGGALAVDSCQTTVGGSIFSGNSARSQGGALFQVCSQELSRHSSAPCLAPYFVQR